MTLHLQLSDLPRELIQLIASFLDKKELLNFRLVNRYIELNSRNSFLKKAAEDSIIQIACGRYSSYLVEANGTLYAWGYNNFAQLGLGHNNHCKTPQVVTSVKNVVSITVGGNHTLAVTKNGMIYAWGFNTFGQLGLGRTNILDNTPQVVKTLKDVASIVAGNDHTLAVTKDGALYTWGRNESGQLGLGHNTHCMTPEVLTTLKDVVSIIAGGFYTVAVTKDSSVYTWGYNGKGQLGLAHTNNCMTPQKVTSLKNVVNIIVGEHRTFAITRDGTFYAWGRNDLGELGLGHNNECKTPQVVTALKNIVSVTAGGYHTFAITKDGALYAWGHNNDGQLGLGHTFNCNIPQVVTALKNVVSLSAGEYHTLAMTKDNILYAWGSNASGQLGLGSDAIMANTPMPLPQFTNMGKIIDSITKREYKKRELTNILVTQETKKALLDQLDSFLSSYWKFNSFSLETLFKFFVPQDEIKWAQDLKNFIAVKNSSIESIENEIEYYKTLNYCQKNDPGKKTFENCVNEMMKILSEAKNPLLESIKDELHFMMKKI